MLESRSFVVSLIGGVRLEAEKTSAVAHPPARQTEMMRTAAPAHDQLGYFFGGFRGGFFT